MKTRIRVISILAVLVFALAANPMMYAKGAELTYEEMVLSNTYPANVEVTREIELEQPALEAYYTMLNSFEAIYGDNNYITILKIMQGLILRMTTGFVFFLWIFHKKFVESTRSIVRTM